MQNGLYIGVLSGTSMDGIDAALVSIEDQSVATLGHCATEYPDTLKKELFALCLPGENEIQRSGMADIAIGKQIASTVNLLLQQQQLAPHEIVAIGSHGQTIRHSVDTHFPFSLQIGNPSVVAQETGITTIADFRMADIAANGQGAPLAPAFHEAVFSSPEQTRFIVNLGGIANITRLEAGSKSLGYDTGPANTLLDQWCQQCTDNEYDKEGLWARSGKLDPALLESLLSDEYLARPAPKSTGREHFNLIWLTSHLAKFQNLRNQDIQRTLVEFSAVTITKEINRNARNNTFEVFLCGGGVHNTFFVERLAALLPEQTLKRTNELGIHTQLVEASTFAWLAYRTLNKIPGNLTSVTGAKKPKILGGIYYP